VKLNKCYKNKEKVVRQLEHQQEQIFSSIKRREWEIAKAREFSRINPNVKRDYIPAPSYEKLADVSASITSAKKLLAEAIKIPPVQPPTLPQYRPNETNCKFAIPAQKVSFRKGKQHKTEIIVCSLHPTKGVACVSLKRLFCCPI
jgi:hypothetical protein